MADAERGSASIANSRIHKNGVSAGFAPVFQTLNSWESEPHNAILTHLGIAMDVLQFVAFALSPYFSYLQPIVKELVYFVFATVLPIWQRDYGPVAYEYYAIPFFFAFAFVTAAIVLFVLLCLRKIESTNRTVSNACRYMSETIAGWMLLPLLHLFLGGMNCGAHNRVLNFNEQVCWDGLHSAVVAIGVIGVIITVFLGVIFSTTLSDSNPQSKHVRARPHNYVEFINFSAKVLLVILFHILVEREAYGSFNILLAAVSMALVWLHALALAFYGQYMTTVRCCTYAITAFIAIVNCITVYCGRWFFLHNINSFVLAALLPFAAGLGYIASRYRLNPELGWKMKHLLQNGTVPLYLPRFPFLHGIMSHDQKMVPIKFKTLENDVLSEAASTTAPDQPPSWEEMVYAVSETMVPFIENVMISTDAEVAVRFIQKHQDTTNLSPSANSIAFCSRIYMKALVLWKRSGVARFQFANFLYIYANRLNLALDLLNEVDCQVQNEHDMLILYSSFKVGVRVKELFGVRDNTHLYTLQRARQYHKEALSDMVQFWAKLMESKGDIIGLALLTNQLTEKRHNALQEYERALSTQKADRLLLSTFASFLEQVMCDESGAEAYREMAEEVAEEKKNRIMRGSKSKNDVAVGNTKTVALPDDDDDEEDEQELGSSALTRVLVVFLFIVGLCSLGIFVMQVVRFQDYDKRVSAISAIGSTRSFASEGVYYTILANDQRNFAGCTNATCSDSQFRDSLYKISLAERDMRINHNKATYGELSAPRSSEATQFSIRRETVTGYLKTGRAHRETSFTVFGRPASAERLPFGVEADAIQYIVEPWMNVHRISTYLTTVVNRMYDGSDYSRSFLFLSSTFPEISLTSLERFVAAHRTAIVSAETTFLVILCVVFGISFVMLVAAYGTFFTNLRAVGHTKVTILKLFTLIPYPTQETLQKLALNRIEQFEKMTAEDEGNVGSNDQQDDLGPDPDDDEPKQDPLSTSFQRRSSTNSGQAHTRGMQRGLDDDVRRMSRFFGAARSTSQTAFPSILKKPNKPKSKRKKRVQFKIEGEVHAANKKLREPKVRIDTKPTDLVMELEKSIKDIEQQSAQETEQEKLRKDQETEKMIYGGLRSQQATMKRQKEETVLEANPWTTLWVYVARPLIALLVCAALVLIVISYQTSANADDRIGVLNSFNVELNAFVSRVEQLLAASASFINFGRTEHYATVREFVTMSSFEPSEALNAIFTSEAERFQLRNLASSTEILVEDVLDSVALAARVLVATGAVTAGSVSAFVTMDRSANTISPEFVSKYPLAVSQPNEFLLASLKDLTTAPGVTSSTLLNTTMQVLTCKRSSQDYLQFMKEVNATRNMLVQRENSSRDADKATIESLAAATLACFAAAAALCLLDVIPTLINLIRQKSLSERSFVELLEIVLVTVVLVFAVVGIPFSYFVLRDASNVDTSVTQAQDAFTAALETRSNLVERQQFQVLRFSATRNYLTLLDIGDRFSSANMEGRYTRLARSVAAAIGTSSSVEQVRLYERRWMRIQDVALWLSEAAWQKAGGASTASVPTPPFLATYDYAQEEGNVADSIQFAAESAYQYRTPAVDGARSGGDLYTVARQAITGRRANYRYGLVYEGLTTIISDVLTRQITDAHDAWKSIRQSQGIVIAMAGVCVLVGIVLVLLPLIEDATANSVRSSQAAQHMMNTLFLPTLRRCQLALAILGLVVVAQFIIAVITTPVGEQAADIMHNARNREYLIAQSATRVLKLNASVQLHSVVETQQLQEELRADRSALALARNNLYFASSATSTSFVVVSSLSSAQRSVTFNGGSSSLDNAYLNYLNYLDAITSLSLPVVTVINASNTLANTYRVDPTTVNSVLTISVAVAGSVDSLLTKLRASNSQYETDMSAALQRSLVPDVILLVVVILVALFQIYFVFMPVTEQLTHEEKGAKLMLSMIPAVVREAVPKITMYLETGMLIQEDDERELYTRDPKAKQFLAEWQHAENPRECMKLLDQSSCGQILIDAHGIVHYANKHIPTLLGYTDLEGKNISVLLEEPLRSLHDGFLKRFVQQGTSRIVGSGRDVVALAKNKEKVHCYLNLDEAVSSTGATFFLGGLERYQVEDVKNGRRRSIADGPSAAAAGKSSRLSAESLAKVPQVKPL